MLNDVFTAVSSQITAFVTEFTTFLPTALAVLVGFIGLGIAIRYVRKWIGRKA